MPLVKVSFNLLETELLKATNEHSVSTARSRGHVLVSVNALTRQVASGTQCMYYSVRVS
jgi:hypothetical protein